MRARPGPRAPGPMLAAALVGAVLVGCSPAGSSAGPAATPGGPRAATASAAAASPAAASPARSSAATGFGDPVTVFELAEPVVRYQEHVAARLGLLAVQVDGLSRAVAAGDLTAARAAWLAAHLTYHRLGAAYGAFGDAGTAIDRLANGLPEGVADPGFTGFHRIEQALWRGGGTAEAVGPVARLAHDVQALRAGAGALDIPANAFTVRAHEILEDTLQFQLTGQDDYGSGTSLATAEADLEGTRTVVELLAPVIGQRSPELVARIRRDLDAVDAVLTAALRAGGGRWPAVQSLPPALRRRVNAAVGQAVETLAPVPGLLEVEEDND